MFLCPHIHQLRQAHPQTPPLRPTDLLGSEDRQLLDLWLSGSVGAGALASVLHRHRGSLYRRLRRLNQRLLHPMAQFIADRAPNMSLLYLEVATRRFLRGHRKTQIMHDLNLSRHQLDNILDHLQTWCNNTQQH